MTNWARSIAFGWQPIKKIPKNPGRIDRDPPPGDNSLAALGLSTAVDAGLIVVIVTTDAAIACSGHFAVYGAGEDGMQCFLVAVPGPR